MTAPKTFHEAVTFAIAHETALIAKDVEANIRRDCHDLDLLDNMAEELTAMIREIVAGVKFRLVLSGTDWPEG